MQQVRWSAEDRLILAEMYRRGLKIRDIAKKFNRTEGAVHKAITRSNIARKSKPHNRNCVQITHELPKIDVVELILNYLNSKGFCTKRLDDGIFELNGNKISALKLLLIANKIRIEEKQPIFIAEDIMCY